MMGKRQIKIIFIALIIFFSALLLLKSLKINTVARAADSSSAPDEAAGKIVFGKLQAKTVECKDLSDNDFEALGKYYMKQMAGSSHDAMNKMMSERLGEEGERQMHIAMGKRLSGCDSNAIYPDQVSGFGPMMGGGGYSMMGYSWGNMMNAFWGYNWLGVLMMIIFWILIIAGIIWLVRYFSGSTDNVTRNVFQNKTPLEILKERYAKGEIDKEEFEEKKKDLT